MLLALFEATEDRRITAAIATFGAAPMFFYVLHLYVLKAGYLVAYALYGPNQGEYLSVPDLGTFCGSWPPRSRCRSIFRPVDSPAGSGGAGISPGCATSETCGTANYARAGAVQPSSADHAGRVLVLELERVGALGRRRGSAGVQVRAGSPRAGAPRRGAPRRWRPRPRGRSRSSPSRRARSGRPRRVPRQAGGGSAPRAHSIARIASLSSTTCTALMAVMPAVTMLSV